MTILNQKMGLMMHTFEILITDEHPILTPKKQ